MGFVIRSIRDLPTLNVSLLHPSVVKQFLIGVGVIGARVGFILESLT